MNKSALVIFKEGDLSQGGRDWKHVDTIIAPSPCESWAKQAGIQFISLESLVEGGSVQEAAQILRRLSLLTAPSGERIAKTFVFKGFELWWIRYGDLMHRFCFPYTQYQKLLSHLTTYSRVTLCRPPSAELLTHFLTAHGIDHKILGETKSMPAWGVFLQFVLSAVFLPWAWMRRSKVMVWTSDLFDPPRDHDFRMRYIYEDLSTYNIPFIEFIRSLESSGTVIRHAIVRRRPVVYSTAIVDICHWLATPFNQANKRKVAGILKGAEDQEKLFWLLVTTHYLNNTAGTIWSIRVMKALLRCLGIKASIVPDATSRTFYDVLASKLLNIPVIGIMHGAVSQYYNVSDFSPEFDGKRSLFVDKYGMWSEGWREYYLKYSRAYKPEELVVSGLMRPLAKSHAPHGTPASSGYQQDSIKVLLVPGQLSNPQEVMPYLLKLMAEEGVSVYVTFRPYRDEFEKWIRHNHPEVLEKIGTDKILLGDIHNAIAQCDVVVGSYSTATLEALLQLKPILFFNTHKWGDYFSIKDFDAKHAFFAENPEEFVKKLKEVQLVSPGIIRDLQERFFGDPYKNGSRWLIKEVLKLL